jgi:hypothetical protein
MAWQNYSLGWKARKRSDGYKWEPKTQLTKLTSSKNRYVMSKGESSELNLRILHEVANISRASVVTAVATGLSAIVPHAHEYPNTRKGSQNKIATTSWLTQRESPSSCYDYELYEAQTTQRLWTRVWGFDPTIFENCGHKHTRLCTAGGQRIQMNSEGSIEIYHTGVILVILTVNLIRSVIS